MLDSTWRDSSADIHKFLGEIIKNPGATACADVLAVGEQNAAVLLAAAERVAALVALGTPPSNIEARVHSTGVVAPIAEVQAANPSSYKR